MLLAGPYANAWARNGNEVLTSHHYLCHWIALLNVEELRIIADLKELDIHNISFLKKLYWKLKFPTVRYFNKRKR